MSSVEECSPLYNNTELLNFFKIGSSWNGLIEHLQPRCYPRVLGTNYNIMDISEIVEIDDTEVHSKVLVCHDLAGNYRNDRFINDTPKWDDYRFYNWSGIDIFCYFSHNYITIPTMSWINAAHKNGVKMIGTFITEGNSGRLLLEQVLSSESYMKQVANSLVLICKYCKFEGWLLNIECSLNNNKAYLLRDFVSYLTQRIHEDIPNGIVIWYDSIIETGALEWQNELNLKNRMFFDVCDGIFLNYTWNENNLLNTKNLIDNDSNRNEQDVFVGIDVFGRGQKAKFHTNETLAKVKKHKFSVAIFAPGWTYETTPDVDIHTPEGNEMCNYKFIMRNDFFWYSLWKYLYTSGPMNLPFYTSFCIGSGKVKRRCGAIISYDKWFNLCKQEYQPSIPTLDVYRNFDDSFDGGSCLEITSHFNKRIRLFVCDFDIRNGIILSFAFKRNTEAIDLEFLITVISNYGQCTLICGENITNNLINGEKNVECLKDPLLKMTLMRLQDSGDKFLPKTSPINGWEIRFFYLNFDQYLYGRITDIGFRTKEIEPDLNLRGETILLGGVSIHKGVLFNDDLSIIDKIDEKYFM